MPEWKDKFAFNTNNQIVHTGVRVAWIQLLIKRSALIGRGNVDG